MQKTVELPKGKESRICVLRCKLPPEDDEPIVIHHYLREAGYLNVDVVDIDKLTSGAQLDEVMTMNYDLIFNVCDGGKPSPYSGQDVCGYLDQKCEVPFVGPLTGAFDPSRQLMKLACALNNILTPKYAFVYDLEKDFQRLNELSFPMIVKHYNSCLSVGLTDNSKVTNKEELYVQVKRMLDLYHGALVEQFIDGKEITCLVAETGVESQIIAYEPVEHLFQEGDTFFTEHVRNITYRKVQKVQMSDKVLSEKVKEISIVFFKAMNARSYTRMDLRSDSNGNVYMLEINPIPGTFYLPKDHDSGDLILLRAPGGSAAFFEHVIRAAVRRHQKERKYWKIVHSNVRGFSNKAIRDFSINEVVYDWSDKVVKIRPISKLSELVNSPGEALIKERFYLPVSSTQVIISENHLENYKFFRPSDDPNCWLEGLRLVAKREIAAGEDLSFDYSTLYGSDWTNLYTGDSSETNWKQIELKYSGHVSEFVKAMAAKQL